jgi:hypothetical protein
VQAIVVRQPIAFLDLRRQLSGTLNAPTCKAVVLHLVAAERLSIDPRTMPFSDDTFLYPGGAFSWDPFDSVWESSGSSTSDPFASYVNSVPISLSQKT